MMEGRMSVYCPVRDSFKGPVYSSFDSEVLIIFVIQVHLFCLDNSIISLLIFVLLFIAFFWP